MKEILLQREGDHRRTFAFVLEPDEDPIIVLTDRAHAYALASCQITAVGGFARATLGYFERKERSSATMRKQKMPSRLLGSAPTDPYLIEETTVDETAGPDRSRLRKS